MSKVVAQTHGDWPTKKSWLDWFENVWLFFKASDEEGELAAQEEEVEAMTLQKRMAARLDEEDFFNVQEVCFFFSSCCILK